MIFSSAPVRRTVVLLLLGFCALFHDAKAARRPGAPRPLRVVQLDGTPLPGDVLNGVLWRAKNSDEPPVLFFSCATNGTRNLWRAIPDAAATGADAANLLSLTWRATPLTRLNAPSFADNVVPLPDGRSVLCVSNVFDNRRGAAGQSGQDERTRIARLDINGGRLNALTPASLRATEPAVSPDGAHFAYVASGDNRRGAGSNSSTLLIADFDGGPPVAVENARHPRWLDAQTLLVQGSKPGSQGVYRVQIPLALDGMQLLFSRAGSLSLQAAASPDGALLCVAEEKAPSRDALSDGPLQQLYVLSADGSGARAVTGTAGAANPSFAPDGSAVLFDAPLQTESGATARGLWLLPLNRSVPVALLLGVRAMGPDLAIMGTAFCEGETEPRVRLEVGQGSAPTRWMTLNVARAPIHQATLARWRPPVGATGDWLLRLTVSDSDNNGTQSTYPLTLPLEAPDDSPPTPILPGLPLPALPPAPQPALPQAPQPRTPQPSAPQPRTPRPQTPPRPITPLPTPTLLVARPTPPPLAARPTLPTFPAAPPPAPSRPAQAPSSPGESGFKLRLHLPRRTSKPPRRIVARLPIRRVIKRPAATTGDAARIEVVGTPAVMKPGETLSVSGMVLNNGTRAWTSDGPQPVRLLVRWTELTTGSSAGWRVVWPQVPIAPGQKLKLPFAMTAPSRAGRYRLTYSLLRLNGPRVVAPSYGATIWPGEFGTIAFLVIVR